MEEDLEKTKKTKAVPEDLFPDLPSEYQDGRDELNLAEFPISAIGSRSDPSVKTLRFEDRTFDKASGEMIHRRLTITASDEHGLPTTADDEVLLGLLQMSRLQKFESPQVTFTPYQLIRILGWTVSTYNYKRIREAIDRWLGVTLYYENAWRDKKTGQWVDASFHFIEFVEYYKPGKEGVMAQDGSSIIKWNDLIFRNFKEGNLKTLDFHFYRSLESGIAKRMFRFLDKRFHFRSRLSFALEAFACEKIGLTRPTKVSYTGRSSVDVAQIKRRLMPGIKELEALKFISAIPEKKRFTKDSAGVWQVHFERYFEAPIETPAQPVLEMKIEDVSVLEGRMIGHGVSKSQARRFVSEFDNDRIEIQLEALEFLLAKGGDSAPVNRGGWLSKAIVENYGPPKGFKSRAQLEQEAHERAETLRKKEEQRRKKRIEDEARQADEKAREAAENRRIEAYMASLTLQERQKIENDATADSPFANREGSVFRKAVINSHVLKLLKELEKQPDEE